MAGGDFPGWVVLGATNGANDGVDITYAVITFTSVLIERCLKLIIQVNDLRRKDKAIRELHLRETHVTWYGLALLEALRGPDAEQLDAGDWELLTAEPSDEALPNGIVADVGMSTLVVNEIAVWWECSAADGHCVVETPAWTTDDLIEIRDTCTLCREPKDKHSVGKCLFGATYYTPMTGGTK